MKLSARNTLPGTVRSLKTLGIKKGKKVFAVIKASNVMVGVD